ncbi:MAG: glutamine--fructose-6-phosphate transaminase (isomerizing) [Planctomycetota bacterium]
MCGIVAYIGPKPAAPLLLEGLKRLEYRGYDSAGLAVVEPQPGTPDKHHARVLRAVGRVSVLEHLVADQNTPLAGRLGIAHTRWATHGEVTEPNAHPHAAVTPQGHTLAIVHNGIIENYAALRRYLETRGHAFTGETDTEVLAHLIAELYPDAPDQAAAPGALTQPDALEQAVQAALREVVGAYAIAAVCSAEPHTLVAARKGSPLIIGLADRGYVVASDASAIVAHTAQAIHLDDYQVARLCAGPGVAGLDAGQHPDGWGIDFRTTTLENEPVSTAVHELELDLQQIELGGFEHFMLKEICEQPEALRNCLRGRIDRREGRVVLGGLAQHARDLARASRFVVTGQGTAYHAALLGAYLLEDLAKTPAVAAYASEFRYRNPIIEDGTVIAAVSQSGETADTLAALTEARERGALALGVVNVVGSTISRSTDAGVYLRVGPEIGVASTKAFLGQVCVLTLIALSVGRRRYLSPDQVSKYLDELQQIPELVERVVQQSDQIKDAVAQVVDRDNWLFLGRGYNYPVAMEGALKLKEISYIHAEGMPAAEMKHGPIALIDRGMPVVFVTPRGSQYDKAISNIEEVRARGGRILAVADEDDDQIDRYADFVFRVPHVSEALQPLVTTAPLQLLAYHAAVARGQDVDKPRNLAKSVTVE